MTTYTDGSPMSPKNAKAAAAAKFFACGCRNMAGQKHHKDCRFAATNERDAAVIEAAMRPTGDLVGGR